MDRFEDATMPASGERRIQGDRRSAESDSDIEFRRTEYRMTEKDLLFIEELYSRLNTLNDEAAQEWTEEERRLEKNKEQAMQVVLKELRSASSEEYRDLAIKEAETWQNDLLRLLNHHRQFSREWDDAVDPAERMALQITVTDLRELMRRRFLEIDALSGVSGISVDLFHDEDVMSEEEWLMLNRVLDSRTANGTRIASLEKELSSDIDRMLGHYVQEKDSSALRSWEEQIMRSLIASVSLVHKCSDSSYLRFVA